MRKKSWLFAGALLTVACSQAFPAGSRSVPVNPILPLWEHVADPEPRVFDGRLYLYGSHDKPNGWDFCLDDYVCWSAPTNDLGVWRCEGVIFAKTDDPENREDGCSLYAPDVVRGCDGRYYLYYQRDLPTAGDGKAHLGVAVCDRPAGRFRPLGYVRREDGTLLGDRAGDSGFDPSVLVDGSEVWLYCGSAGSGCHVFRLATDMLTIVEERGEVIPPLKRSQGTRFEGHAFFEASSARKIDGRYVLVYSEAPKIVSLGYATAETPYGPFTYRGELVVNDGGNDHGGLVRIGGDWYQFYHRSSNGTVFSRKCCAERLVRTEDGGFARAEMTSQGLTGAPLPAKGSYSAATAFLLEGGARVEQIGEGPAADVFVGNMTRDCQLGFRYFDCCAVVGLALEMRGWCSGFVEVRLDPAAQPIGKIPLRRSQNWKFNSAEVSIPDGVHALYLTFRLSGGCGLPQFRSFVFKGKMKEGKER